jgi:hypothetical protein
MTILDTAIAVFIGVTVKDVLSQGYYELRYRLNKRKPNRYKFLLENLEEEEN